MTNKTYATHLAAAIDNKINRVENDSEKGFKIVCDVDFESVNGIAATITPVPGGVWDP